MKKPTQTKEKKHAYTEITNANILNVRQFNDIVFAGLEINGVRIYGCKVVEGKNGDFISFPQSKGKDGNYYPIVSVYLSPEDTALIIGAIEEKLNSEE